MDNKICKIHNNEPALFRDKNNKQNIVFLCRFCVQQRIDVQNIDDFEKEEKEALKQLEMKFDQHIKKLQNFAEKLEHYTQQIQQKLKKLTQNIQQNIKQIIEKKNQVKSKSIDFTILQLNVINEEENIINNVFEQMQQQIKNQLKELEISNNLDQLLQLLQIDVNENENRQEEVQQVAILNKKIDYQYMQQSSYKLDGQCFAFAFNNDAKFMIANCKELIKVFELQDDKFNEVQYLNGHSKNVTCLHFMKKSNQFISASDDSNLVIWQYNKINQWQTDQVLRGHSSLIRCIAVNIDENLLISGSADKTIKFWQKVNNNWSCIQSLDTQSQVYSVSLSNKEFELIASVHDNKILMIKLSDKIWIIKQNIPVEQLVYRLCYISQNQFVCQIKDSQNLLVFDYDSRYQSFKKGLELQYLNKAIDFNCLFPIRYISEIGLIMVKNDHHVHLIKRSQNGQFTVEQSINFHTNCLYGGMSDDGRLLATWDFKSKEIQLRKFEY